MKIYKFNIKISISGPFSIAHSYITISSKGETEEEAYNKLKESLHISDIYKVSSIQIKSF